MSDFILDDVQHVFPLRKDFIIKGKKNHKAMYLVKGNIDEV